MKKVIQITVLFGCLLFLSNAKAAGIIGSETSWNSMGNDTFEITLSVYISCTSGGAAFAPVAPTITSDSCTNAYSISVGNYYSWTMEDITPLCKSATRICIISGGSGNGTPSNPEGVEKHIFKYKIYLGGAFANCCWYKIHWEYCCRPNTISTGPASSILMNDAWLNRCSASIDHSPNFNISPILIKCGGQDVVYNHGAIDYDGDSLSYELAPPTSGNYSSPWSYKYPITCLGGNNPNPNASPATGFNLNPINGEILFRPMQVQNSVLMVMVSEWRKDSTGTYRMIGKLERDMEIIIIQNCNDKLPTLSGPYFYNACAGQQLCISYNTNDQDFADTTRIYWDREIPNAIWSDNNGSVKHASGTLCWTPTTVEIRDRPYYFTLTAEDNHCPLIGNVSKIYAITVLPTPQNNRAYTKITCSLIEFKAIASGSQFSGATYNWFVPVLVGGGVPSIVYDSNAVCQYQFLQGGKYLIKNAMWLNGCNKTYIDTLVVDSVELMHIVSNGDSVLCPGETRQLLADSALSYQWYVDGVMLSGATSKTYNASSAGKYEVRRNKTGCYVGSNAIVLYESVNPIINKSQLNCFGDTVKYKAIGKTGATYQWYRNGLPISGATGNGLAATQDGNYYCIITEPGCVVQTKTDTLVFLTPPVTPTIIQNGGSLICSTAFSYQWYFDTLVINGANGMTYNPPKTGKYRVKTTGANGCSAISNVINYTVGITTNNALSKTTISPNPFQDKIQIHFDDAQIRLLVIYDVRGRKILEQNIVGASTEVNVAEICDGVYFLEVSECGEKAVFKMMKQSNN